MRTIRRLYFYAVAFISIEVVLWGVIGLTRNIVSSRLHNTADALAQALALVLVGVPIFLFHWLWTQRASAKDEEEQTASLRAIFFYTVLIATLVPIAQNLLALIDRAILTLASLDPYRALLGGNQTWQDNLIAIVINGVVAAYFWNVLRGEWKSLPDANTFADVRRLYRYLWMLYGLLMVVFGAQQVLRFVFYIPVPKYLMGSAGRETFANGLSLLIVGTPLWVYTWRIIQDAIAAPVERDSNLRLGVLYLLSLGGVISVLSASGTLLDIILRWAFGEAMAGYEFIQQIGGPISLGVPLAGVWAYYGAWLNLQIESDENDLQRASKKRLYYYILSALGLGAAVIGIALLLSFVIDILTTNAIWGTTLRSRLAGSIATLVVGLPLWLMTWRPMQAAALTDDEQGDHARRSNIRRAYLYLALFAGVIGGMVSAVALIYNLINTVLVRSVSSDFLSNVLNSIQLLAIFAVLLVYHLNCLRQDGTKAEAKLEARQRGFNVMVLGSEEDAFVKVVKAAMSKQAPNVPLSAYSPDEAVKQDAQAIILPVSLAVEPPDRLRKWLQAFSGEKIVVTESVSGWVLNGLSAEQAAKLTRQLAEGEKVRLTRPYATWEVVKTVAVVLVSIQILFLLFGLAMSLLSR